ncbi:MAG: hypothetical protein A2Z83_05975 [Omnitrophica bacterium GWA2_52_8]|nr:MAG: hypothetical protein A2Z83_05975 [Omnitrophica bacterium GWA2_52_8]
MNSLLPVRIIVLNYNGEELLPKCLPSIVDAARHYPPAASVTVLDNGSTDQGLRYVGEMFPEVDIYRAPHNHYLCSYNEYLKKITEPVCIFLNNDIRVDPGFIAPLVEKFNQDPQTFMVAPRVMDFDGLAIQAGPSKWGMRYGLFWCSARYPGYEEDAINSSSTVSSGFGAFSRKKFLELGGYDPIFLPGIFEDVDLCFRAQKQGDSCYYAAQSIVYHMGQASFKKKFGSEGIKRLAARNNFLFMRKNMRGIYFFVTQCLFVPLRIALSLMKGDGSLLRGFFDAFFKRKVLSDSGEF